MEKSWNSLPEFGWKPCSIMRDNVKSSMSLKKGNLSHLYSESPSPSKRKLTIWMKMIFVDLFNKSRLWKRYPGATVGPRDFIYGLIRRARPKGG